MERRFAEEQKLENLSKNNCRTKIKRNSKFSNLKAEEQKLKEKIN